MPHEICQALIDHELPLAKTLKQMLNDHSSHCTERRGCGFTQATRFLSTYINQPIDPVAAADLRIFAAWPIQKTERLAHTWINAGWPQGWRCLHHAPDSFFQEQQQTAELQKLRSLIPTLEKIQGEMSLPESQVFLDLVIDLLTRRQTGLAEIPGMPVKPEIGSCSQAEEFFLEIAHNRIRRGGQVNTIVDENNQPLMLEKMNLGESHSAFVVAAIQICGIRIPPGSLCALKYDEPVESAPTTRSGVAINIKQIREARFLRLTTLSLEPKDRIRAFSHQVQAQIRSQMLSPTSTTIAQLQAFAAQESGSLSR